MPKHPSMIVMPALSACATCNEPANQCWCAGDVPKPATPRPERETQLACFVTRLEWVGLCLQDATEKGDAERICRQSSRILDIMDALEAHAFAPMNKLSRDNGAILAPFFPHRRLRP